MSKKKTKPANSKNHRKAAAKAAKPHHKFFDRLKGKIKIVGDILSPIVPPEDWTYDLDNLDKKRPI